MPRLSGPLLLVALLVLAAIVVVVERLVVTDEEAIEALVERALEAVEAEDAAGLTACVHPEYEGQGGPGHAVVAYVRSLYRQYGPDGLRADVSEIDVEGERARARLLVRFRLMARPMALPLEAGFRREASGWRIDHGRQLERWP